MSCERRCCRQNCEQEAETQITSCIEGREEEQKVYLLCLSHYYQVMAVAQAMRALTGMPTITSEGGQRGV